eukprot:CAMPEP_0114984716 /NCGR_PEP_ID=MMETSP0216-20121206/7434_1 /TAXON_ID=223996 /ORGANISM="Protocruzia adherens, Strain Boccale" /LENGTH=632 /DNA_ID=CAMNT_0002346889 /DNA_START=214 /DNA_END=2112 /DNA_ORIENTATION=+
MEKQFDKSLDHCEFGGKAFIEKQIEKGEKVIYSDPVTKYNHKDKAQRRFIMVTTKGIYNIAKGMSFISDSYVVKRKIPLNILVGMTISKHSPEFVLHCSPEYDYRMRGSSTKDLVKVLKALFEDINGRELCVFEYDKSTLIDVCTTKFDAKRKVSKLPDQIRLEAETKDTEKKVDSPKATKTEEKPVEKKETKNETKQPDADKETKAEPVKETGDINAKTEPTKTETTNEESNKKEEKKNDDVSAAATAIISKLKGSSSSDSGEEEKKSAAPTKDGDTDPTVGQTSVAQKIFGAIVGNVIFSRPGDDVSLDAFELKKVIGRGSFGKVMLVIKKDNQRPYAMKSLRKDIILESDQLEHTRIEKEIMQSVTHEFLMGLEYCFQTPDKVYFITKYMSGGDMFTHLRNAFKFPEELAKFYIAQIALGLDHLHKMDIIYRDMKPENILVGADGFLKLTDFGMAKKVHRSENIKSFYGTPEYIAPEALKDHRFEKASDWWSLGVLLFEMMVGAPPFYNQSTDKMYELIKNADLRFPMKQEISPSAKDLISKLLTKDPTERLGANEGVEDIKNHIFFKGFNWEQLEGKSMTAPWKPTVEGACDTQNFDSEFTSEAPVDSMVPSSKLAEVAKRQQEFAGI